MPFVEKGFETVLVCVNHAHASHEAALPTGAGTTLVRAAGSYLLRGAEPREVGSEVVAAETRTVIPIVVFYCTVCGYMETYHEVTVDPERWPRP